MNWFDRIKKSILSRIKKTDEKQWKQCRACQSIMRVHDLALNQWVCDNCNHHYLIGYKEYIDILADKDTIVEINNALTTTDPLKFTGYKEKLEKSKKSTGLNEAIFTGLCTIGGYPIALGIMDFRFLTATLSGAVGEKIVRLIEKAIKGRRALIIVCSGGGARMQESTFSLMQLAKVSAAIHRFANHKLLYIPILTDPTLGGTTASVGMLGDIILAEPKARIGFAGERVIRQFLQIEKLPDGFQSSEFVLKHGFIDRIVSRSEMRSNLVDLVGLFRISH